jgi:hypothetical protein
MLSSCLVLGCAVSSFIYRRQEKDRYQTLIFVVAITAASTIGLASGVCANLVMLGLIPWALCLSMLFSSILHWLVKRYSRRQIYIIYEVDENEVLQPQ